MKMLFLNSFQTIMFHAFLLFSLLIPLFGVTYASQANSGYTSVFSVGDTSSPMGYVALIEVKNIKLSTMTVPALDTTHLQSPNATEEMVPGLIKPGTISITGNFIGDTTQLDILTTAEGQTLVSWKITAPVQKGTKTYTASGTGFWVKYEVGSIEPNKPVEFTADFQITGTVTEGVA